MKLAYADRAEYLGDPAVVNVPVKLASPRSAYAAAFAPADPTWPRATGERDQGRSTRVPTRAIRPRISRSSMREGNAVSNTYTLNFSYGVGMVADGTGVLLNNELDDFAAKPGAPNAYGLTGGKANQPGPRKRPLSSMSPTMMFKDGKLELVTGSPGGSRIITIVLEIILDVVDFGLNIAEATAAVRIHDQLLPDSSTSSAG